MKGKFTEFLSVAGGGGVTWSDRNSFSRVWCGKSELGHFTILQLQYKDLIRLALIRFAV